MRASFLATLPALLVAVAHQPTVASEASRESQRLSENAPLVVTHATLWTEHGALADQEIVIRDGRVAAVGKSGTLARPGGARTIDAAGHTLLPGLIDSHTHPYFFDLRGDLPPEHAELGREHAMSVTARQMLRSGVTAARVHLADLATAAPFKRDASRDSFPSPRLQLGNAIWRVASVEDAVTKVRQLKQDGADWLALHSLAKFQRDHLVALVAEARRVGLGVLAGGDPIAEAQLAVELGVDSIEYLDRTAEPRYPEPLLAQMKARGTALFLVPPVGFYHRYISFLDGAMPVDRSRHLAFMPEPIAVATLATMDRHRTQDPNQLGKNIRAGFASMPGKFRQLREAGLQLVVGSDNGSMANFHADALWWEMETWRQLGVPVDEILRAATVVPAALLRESDIGHLRIGARADFVLYRGKIDEGAFTVDRVHSVGKGGVLFVEDGNWQAAR